MVGPVARLLVAACLVAACLAAAAGAVDKKFNITVGYLPSLTGAKHGITGLTCSGAITLAIEELNNSTEILPDVKILLEWHDTLSSETVKTQLFTKMISSGVTAVFGPEDHCGTEATLAQSMNIPIIPYKCSDYQPSTLSNFVKLEPSNFQASKSVISLLRYYRWNKFSLIYDESWQNVALTFEDHAAKNNMTITHQLQTFDSLTCCENKLKCCTPRYWHNLITSTKNDTRIYVFMGYSNDLRDMMIAMNTQGLFSKGLYMVIFVDVELSISSDFLDKYFFGFDGRDECPTPAFKKKAQSLLVVSPLVPKITDTNFADNVRDYNRKGPLYLPGPLLRLTSSIIVKKFVSIYAAYMYDSVKMYAAALDDLIKEDLKKRIESGAKDELSYETLMRIVTNGSRIVERIVQKSPYESVTGQSFRLDGTGQADGNFSVLSFKPWRNFNDSNCPYQMVPVGLFKQNEKMYPEYKLNPRLPIDWPDSVKPDAEPYATNVAVLPHLPTVKSLLAAILFLLQQ